METELKPYDDPYQILSIQLVVDLNIGDICRVLYDDEFTERMVQKETRDLDFYGRFLDCIVEEILVKKERMRMMAELDKLGSWFFKQMDIERLRGQIKKDLDRFDIPWREYMPD